MTLVDAVDDLRTRGFSYAALYLQDPEIAEGLRLNDILALRRFFIADFYKEHSGDKTFPFAGREIDAQKVPSIIVQAANFVRRLLPKDKPLSLEDGYLITAIHYKNREKTTIRREKPPLGNFQNVYNEKYFDPGTASGFFHSVYFFTPFPEDLPPEKFYEFPTRLVRYIATQEETEENTAFAEQVMRRLVTFCNTELKRIQYYYTQTSRGQLSEEEKAKLAERIKLDLRGYNGEFLRDGKQPQPYPSEDFHHDMEYVGDKWTRSQCVGDLERSYSVVDLARIEEDTDFAKKLSQLFRDIVKENPLEYFDPPYTKNDLEQLLE